MNVRRLAPPFAALVICWLALMRIVLDSASRLPQRVATHFGMNGIPNGWMTRNGYVQFTVASSIGVSIFILLVFALIRFFPPRYVNIPHREYWLAPGRRAGTQEFLLVRGAWLACLLAVFMA